MISPFQNPFMLGFDELEDMLFRVTKGADSFPPYNVEQISEELLEITLAVAGYKESDLEVLQEGNQFIVKGHQEPNENHNYLHRGIAARSFIKSFVLADGMKIKNATLDSGLLKVELIKPQKQKIVRQIKIETQNKKSKIIAQNHKNLIK